MTGTAQMMVRSGGTDNLQPEVGVQSGTAPGPTIPVYSVWHEGECKAICDTPQRARWWRRKYRSSHIETTYRYGR